MALSAELEALLSKIDDETVKEATRKQLVENQENGLRQSDYSKKQNELKLEREKLQGEWKKHVDWYNTAKDTYEQSLEDQKALEAQIEELKKLKEETPADLIDEKEVTKQIKLVQDRADAAAKRAEKSETIVLEIDKMIKDGKLMTAEKFDEAVNRKADGLANAILDIVERQSTYQKEFGKELPRQVLIDEAAKHNGNIEAAYESISKKDREEKYQKEVESKYQKMYEDKIRQAGLPIDGSPSPMNSEMGPMQRRSLGIKDEEIPEDVPVDGSGRIGYLLGKQLIKEGKA
jgi:hypothetical protein